MKSIRTTTLLFLVLLLAPSLLGSDFGVRAGRFSESDTEFVGAELLWDLGAVNVNPNIEYWLEDDVTAGTANLDLTVDIGRFSRVTPYVGAGVGLQYLDLESGTNTTDLLGNVIGGLAFDLSFLKPYAQVKYSRVFENDDLAETDDIAFTVGLRF
jgi:opacity protein-like surface antigen